MDQNFEVDVCAFDVEVVVGFGSSRVGSGTATAAWAPPEPTLSRELDPTEIYEYAVLIFDEQRGRELVAAIELVSPANKDRPETCQAFASKCAALLQAVTTRSVEPHWDVETRHNSQLLRSAVTRGTRYEPTVESL